MFYVIVVLIYSYKHNKYVLWNYFCRSFGSH